MGRESEGGVKVLGGGEEGCTRERRHYRRV